MGTDFREHIAEHLDFLHEAGFELKHVTIAEVFDNAGAQYQAARLWLGVERERGCYMYHLGVWPHVFDAQLLADLVGSAEDIAAVYRPHPSLGTLAPVLRRALPALARAFSPEHIAGTAVTLDRLGHARAHRLFGWPTVDAPAT